MGTVTAESAEEQLRIIRARHGNREAVRADDRSIQNHDSHAASASRNGDNTESGFPFTIEHLRTAIANDGDNNRGQTDSTIRPSNNGLDGNDTNPANDGDSESSLGHKPTGLGFESSQLEEEELFTLPPIPEVKRAKNGTVIPPRPKVIDNAISTISDVLHTGKVRTEIPKTVPVQTTQSEKKKAASVTVTKPLTASEANDIKDDVQTLLAGIFSLADSFRYAYLPDHPKASEGNGLFTLDDEELEQGTQWVLRRTSKSAKVTKNVKFAADLYDTYSVPIAIMYPRLKQFAIELRTKGVTIRGR